jgi:hypothetical protein
MVLHGLFSWLPTGVSDFLAAIGAIALWPCYITFLVIALRTGKRKYFVFLGAISLLASIYWHVISAVALSA